MSPATSETPVISMLADDNGSKGKIEIRGSKSVRITSGPPGPLPMSSDDTDGVDVIAGESQKVTIKRGLIDGVDQKIVMEQGSITIDAGSGSITIQSLTEITLSVAGGTSTIRLTASGIVIQGILVQIN